ncbi:hypothetical protein BGZ63DRAFT_466773 [Mariannaea sp. PMI_226]|nr:hypothetical protein BGZ63DRAFT_466773 [Mariannaea sp. PMI_226]
MAAIGHFALFHLPAIAVTSTLLSLYLTNVRWDHPSIEALNALQFAAKAHEAFIIICLTDILLHRIRYGLLVENGILLGFLSSAFHLGSPIQYLLSEELRAAILHSTGKRVFHAITGVMIILIALLCIAASPLSAIVMIPRQGWWRVDFDFDYYTGVWYFHGNLYEMDLGSSQYASLKADQNRGQVSQGALLENVFPVVTLARMGETTSVPILNVTYDNYRSWGRPISLAMDTYYTPIAIATCAMNPIVEALLLLSTKGYLEGSAEWVIKSERKAANSTAATKWKQPLLAVECSQSELPLGTQSASFNFKYLPITETIHIDIEQHPSLKDLLKEVGKSAGPLGYRFLNLRHALGLPISADILFVSTVDEAADGARIYPPQPNFNLCLISAQWTEADVWAEGSKSSAILSHLGFALNDLNNLRDASWETDLIRMQDGWLIDIGFPPQIQSNRSSYQQIMDMSFDNVFGLDKDYLAISLALHITDAIAQLGSSTSVFDGTVYGDLDSQNDPNIQHIALKFLYAYEFQNSYAIPIAFAILILHILITLIHLGIVLLSKHPWQGSNWTTFEQLLVLALRSTAPHELGTVGGGVASSATWRRTAMVRAVGDERQLQIILKDSQGSSDQSQEMGEANGQ